MTRFIAFVAYVLSNTEANKILHSWSFEYEVCSLYYFEALASFHHGSHSHWAFRSQSHQGRAFRSVGDAVSEAPECENGKPQAPLRKIGRFRPRFRNWGASPSSLSAHVRKPERAPSPPSEAPTILSLQPRSRSAAKVKSLLGGAVEQPLAIMPITV